MLRCWGKTCGVVPLRNLTQLIIEMAVMVVCHCQWKQSLFVKEHTIFSSSALFSSHRLILVVSALDRVVASRAPHSSTSHRRRSPTPHTTACTRPSCCL